MAVNLIISKIKEISENRANMKFLRGSVSSAYIHASKLTEFENKLSKLYNPRLKDAYN